MQAETEFKQKFPGRKAPAQSDFLRKRLQGAKGPKYFDSGDHAMALATQKAAAGKKKEVVQVGKTIPTVESQKRRSSCRRKSCLVTEEEEEKSDDCCCDEPPADASDVGSAVAGEEATPPEPGSASTENWNSSDLFRIMDILLIVWISQGLFVDDYVFLLMAY